MVIGPYELNYELEKHFFLCSWMLRMTIGLKCASLESHAEAQALCKLHAEEDTFYFAPEKEKSIALSRKIN